MQRHEYGRARDTLEEALESGDDSHFVLTSLARCYLALGESKSAFKTYDHIFHLDDSAAKVEAALFSKDYSKALGFVNRNATDLDADLSFLLALAEYKSGYILFCQERLTSALQKDFTWEDDDPLDHVAQHVLKRFEYLDFEHIFLDVSEHLEAEETAPQNRWFALNMPVHDVLSASKKPMQNKRALELAQLLSSQFNDLFIGNGRVQLQRILDDLSQSQVNAEFGIKARQALKEKNYSHIAELVLALQLDHLKQFAVVFGLSEDLIQHSHLQKLIPLLPLRLAVAMLFLYSTSDPEDKLPHYSKLKLDDDVLAGLIAACFIVYYQQVERYRASMSG